MADTSVPNLTELTSPATGDLLHIVDVSASADPKDRKITIANLEASFFDTPITIGTNGTTEGGATFAALGSADWHFVPSRVTFESQPDDVFYLGYNVTGAGAFQTPGLQAIYIGMEADYYSSPTTHYAEFYVECYLADQTTSIRPISIGVDLDTGNAINQYKGKNIFFDSDANQILTIDDTATGPVNLHNGTYLRFLTNNTVTLNQLNSAGNNYIPLIYLSDADRVKIGWAGYPVQSDVDLYFGANSVGPILIDRTTATAYRLYVDSGALAIEAV